jgi:hypothetical protein
VKFVKHVKGDARYKRLGTYGLVTEKASQNNQPASLTFK